MLPAYEWNFSDVNPPIHAWAALTIFEIDGRADFNFLARVFQKLLINFTWWVNRNDAAGDNIFEGGFLGLDNIGPFDRSKLLPAGEILEQSDATAWMAKYCLNMLEIALVLANHDSAYEDIALKFFEHFGSIASAMDELWDDEDGFFYDRLRKPDGTTVVVRARSMVGLLPIFASVRFNASLWLALPNFRARARWFLDNAPQAGAFTKLFTHSEPDQLISMVDKPQFRRLFARMLDEQEFLSPFGLRSLSRFHLEHPLVLDLDGSQARLDYEPAESTTPAVRRQFELARPCVVPVQLPRGSIAASPPSWSRGRFHRRAADWLWPERKPRRSGGRDRAAPAQALPARRARASTRAWREPALSARRRVGRPRSLLRIFQRRHGRGACAPRHQTGWTALIGGDHAHATRKARA